MIFKPFDHLVLIEKVEDKKGSIQQTKSGLYVAESSKQAGRFWKVRILGIGNKVELPITEGDLCMCNAAAEIDNFFTEVEKGHMLIMDHHILGKWEGD